MLDIIYYKRYNTRRIVREGGTMDRIVNHVSVVMKARGLNISQLARKAGVHYPVAWRYASGTVTRLDLHNLARICRALEASVGELFEYVPEER